MKVSVIVPVYNAGKYIEKCVNSLIKQTLQDLEIILVNDGSRDNSEEICRRLALQDCRIKVISQENSGVSSARNKGLEEATGDYIGFVDADDEVAETMYEKLLLKSEETNADIVTCAFIEKTDTKEEIKFTCDSYDIMQNVEALQCLCVRKIVSMGIWNKIFKKSAIGNTRFELGKKINEDRFFLFSVLCNSNQIAFVHEPLYYYIKRENSATSGKFDDRWFDMVYFSEKMFQKIKSNFPTIIDAAYTNVCEMHLEVIATLIAANRVEQYKKEYNGCLNRIKKIPINRVRRFLSKEKLVEVYIIKILPILLLPIRKAFSKREEYR